MSETWLSPEEVQELTARKRWSAQCRALARMGIPFRPNAAGRPLVERALALKAKAAKDKPKRTEPDFSSLDKAA
jgi:hypothetical protein